METKDENYDDLVRLNIKLQKMLQHEQDKNKSLSVRVGKNENIEIFVYLFMLGVSFVLGYTQHAYVLSWLQGK